LDRVVGVEGVRDPPHDRPGPEEAEILHFILDLGWGRPGCWQRWLRCWRHCQWHWPGRCWSISRWVGCCISCSVRSRISRLQYFIFASAFFSYRVEGILATTSLARTLRSTSGVRTCCGSTVSGTSFLELSSCNTNVGLKALDHRTIFKVV
jgi:hypothetical protein